MTSRNNVCEKSNFSFIPGQKTGYPAFLMARRRFVFRRDNIKMREAVENVIKDFNLDRSRIFEVSHLKYADIIKKIEKTFIKNGGVLHWSNIENRFNPSFTLKTQYIGNNRLWYQSLVKIIPDTLHYVLFEDTVNFHTKYWVYEMFPDEIITVIDESIPSPDDFYIVSKKFDWLISECHEDVVYFLRDKIDISLIEKDPHFLSRF